MRSSLSLPPISAPQPTILFPSRAQPATSSRCWAIRLAPWQTCVQVACIFWAIPAGGTCPNAIFENAHVSQNMARSTFDIDLYFIGDVVQVSRRVPRRNHRLRSTLAVGGTRHHDE